MNLRKKIRKCTDIDNNTVVSVLKHSSKFSSIQCREMSILNTIIYMNN